MAKQATPQPRPYNDMHDAIQSAYGSNKWGDRIALFCLVIGMVIFFRRLSSVSWLESLNDGILWGLLAYCGCFLLIVVFRSLNHADKESTLVEAGITFLHERKWDAEQQKVLLQRAQIGSAAGQTRTMLPLFLVPIIGGIIVQSSLHMTIQLFIALGLAYVATAFFRELGRANIDVVMVQALAEYEYELKAKHVMQLPPAKPAIIADSTSPAESKTLVPSRAAAQSPVARKKKRAR